MKNKIAIVFPGQGSQVVGMGKDLYENFDSAKKVFKKVDEIFAFRCKVKMFVKICLEN